MTTELDLAASIAVAEPGTFSYVHPVRHLPQAVGTVRRRVRSLLEEWGVTGDTLEEITLVVSELVTNAVRHALPPAELSLSVRPAGRGSRLRVEVRDQGPAQRDVPRRLSDDERGRGCDIVYAVAARCGACEDARGTVRWAEFDCPGDLRPTGDF